MSWAMGDFLNCSTVPNCSVMEATCDDNVVETVKQSITRPNVESTGSESSLFPFAQSMEIGEIESMDAPRFEQEALFLLLSGKEQPCSHVGGCEWGGGDWWRSCKWATGEIKRPLCIGDGFGRISSQGAVFESSLTGADATSAKWAMPLPLSVSSVCLTPILLAVKSLRRICDWSRILGLIW